MDNFISYIFSQYKSYSYLDVVLEATATILGIASVVFSIRKSIFVYPSGIISTALYVYILYFSGLYGDMLINIYYVVLGVYGWYEWLKYVDDNYCISIKKSTLSEKYISVFMFVILFIILLYILVYHTNSSVPYIDSLTTSIFFVGMWHMTKKNIDNWIYWIIGNIISIPLYIYKGLTITSFQFLIMTVLAIIGFIAWKKELNKQKK